MLIIGSTALKHYFPDFNREPSDLDVIKTDSDKKIKIVSDKKIDYLPDPGITKYQKNGPLEPNLLLTLKASHIFWDINFEKHMWDIQFLLNKGCEIDVDIFNELYTFWNTYHEKNKRSDLDMTSDDFFNNALTEIVPHDTIHTFLVPVPAYTKVLVDGAEVQVSEDKFNNLSHQEKLDLVIEEVQVMSWERYRNIKWYLGYYKMLRKFLANHAPMWEAMFIIKHWKELTQPPFNHIKLIDNEVEKWMKKQEN